jgi:transposase
LRNWRLRLSIVANDDLDLAVLELATLNRAPHRVRSVEETDEGLVADIEAVEGRRPQCGHCGRKVRRTKGRTKRRLWRDLKSHSRPEPFQNFARMIRKHKDGILAWTKLRISNGALEGMNNKVKLLSHRSYGFRSDDRYIEAIYHNCANLPLPSDS